jgi:hypothetical protein
MSREERGVNIERRETGHRENLFVEDLSIASDDQNIWTLGSKSFGEGGVTGGLWL